MTPDPRLEVLAAFLYGYRWTPGSRAFVDLDPAMRRQWIKDARAALEAMDAVTTAVTTTVTTGATTPNIREVA